MEEHFTTWPNITTCNHIYKELLLASTNTMLGVIVTFVVIITLLLMLSISNVSASIEDFADVHFSTGHIILTPGDTEKLTMHIQDHTDELQQIIWLYDESNDVSSKQQVEVVEPLQPFIISNRSITEVNFNITAYQAGSVVLFLCINGSELNGTISDGYTLVEVIHNFDLKAIAEFFGWMYFLCWWVNSIPQVYTNCKLQRITGLSFDFVSISFIGHFVYLVYNVSFLWIPAVKNEYRSEHPRGVAPVQLNDGLMAVQKFVTEIIMVVQCICYDSGGQTITKPAYFVLVLLGTVSLLLCFLSFWSVISVIVMLYGFGFIKIVTTGIKYIFQIILNKKTKSTSGYNGYSAMLDFFGGVFSLIQLLLVASNGDDWSSLLGNWAKLFVGSSTLVSCGILMYQKFYLYGESDPYKPIDPGKSSKEESQRFLQELDSVK